MMLAQQYFIAGLLVLAPLLSSSAQTFPKRAYWGDTHVHTALSGDAYAGGVRLMPNAAYRFARGEEVKTNTGQYAQLTRPLDFIVIADHGNNLGAAYYRELYNEDSEFRDSPLGKAWFAAREQLAGGHIDEHALNSEALLPAHRSWQASFRYPEFRASVWERVVAAADLQNKPGEFTAFIGYEWTPSSEEGSAQHRVVVFADDAERTRQILPFTSYDSAYEEELWQYLDRYERKTGGRAISIPHNGNLTSGRMFALTDSWGETLTPDYARTRARFEPIVEVTQIKGDSETHPLLSPDDEFADFERWNSWVGWGGASVDKAVQARYEYARSALQLGVGLQASLGVNPFKFGVIGSTDSHTGLAGADDENFWGSSAQGEMSAKRIFNEPAYINWQMNSAGYAAVWAHENTRESIFDALLRKEVYATTGPRILVRFFAGYDFNSKDLEADDIARVGYTKGVPMGGDLQARNDDEPVFLLMANKDPLGANLDRIQVVKGWVDNGQHHEEVYDAVLSDGRKPDANGTVSAVGNTVDLETATWSDTIGSAELFGLWRDPDFIPGQAAVYYARVLQIPTPRWTLYDKVKFKLKDVPENIPLVTQERAYTSAIWYCACK